MTITPLREIQLHWTDIFESHQILFISAVAAVAKNWDFVSERAFALEFRICLLSCLARETIKIVLFRNFPQKRLMVSSLRFRLRLSTDVRASPGILCPLSGGGGGERVFSNGIHHVDS